jgi:ParB-like chromosome segregation protein Spo0J
MLASVDGFEGLRVATTVQAKAHPFADLFPMMAPDELEALVADIAANGLQQPIVLYRGDVLDGRNRLAACKKAGVEPRFVDHEGDDASAFALVLSLNVQRRDLTAGQRAIVAARVLEQMPERRGGDRRNGKVGNSPTLKSRSSVAQEFKVNEKAVQQAKVLIEKAPDLAEEVNTKKLNITSAYDKYLERVEEAKTRERQRKVAAKYQDAIDAGAMTIQEALMKVQAEEEQEKRDAQTRQLWFGELAKAVKWCHDFVETRSDDYLAWYTHEGALGTEHETTVEDLEAMKAQLDRIIGITLARELSHDSRGKGRATGRR